MINQKKILDACCGGKMFWFQKNHPLTIYIDNRKVEKGEIPQQPNWCVEPDFIMDFRKMDFPSCSFKLIVWDPPHLVDASPKAIMAKKYGVMRNWKEDLAAGFKEIWRVLDWDGTLVFKWCDQDIPTSRVLELFPEKPLFGHPTAKSGKTKWMVFFKSKKVIPS